MQLVMLAAVQQLWQWFIWCGSSEKLQLITAAERTSSLKKHSSAL
jgi:hypothetical protein